MIEYVLIAQGIATVVLAAVNVQLKTRVKDIEKEAKHLQDNRYENMKDLQQVRDELRQIAEATGVEWVPNQRGGWRKK